MGEFAIRGGLASPGKRDSGKGQPNRRWRGETGRHWRGVLLMTLQMTLVSAFGTIGTQTIGQGRPGVPDGLDLSEPTGTGAWTLPPLRSPANVSLTLRVGTVLSLTGPLQLFGESMRDSARLAASQINEAGGGAVTVELLHRDSETSNSTGIAVARELIRERNVSLLIGAVSSGVTRAIAEEVTIPLGVLLISPSATSPDLSSVETGEPGWFWRMAPSDALQGRLLAEWADEVGLTKVAVLAEDGAYGRGIAESFQEHFRGEVAMEARLPENYSDYPGVLRSISFTIPKAVLLAAYPWEAAFVLSEWAVQRSMGKWNWKWIWPEALTDQLFVDLLRLFNIDVRGTRGILPTREGPRFDEFRDAFVLEYHRQPTLFDAHTFDAIHLLALAALAGDGVHPETLRDSLHYVANPPGTVVGPGPAEWTRASGILAAGGDIDYEGASSRIDFDLAGDVGGRFQGQRIDTAWEFGSVRAFPEEDFWSPYRDGESPGVSIRAPEAGFVANNGTVEVNWSASDRGSGLWRVGLQLDNLTPAPVNRTAETYTLTNLTDGTHTVTVTVWDRFRNSQNASVEFRVDTRVLSPIQILSLAGLGAAAAGGAVLLALLWRRRRRRAE